MLHRCIFLVAVLFLGGCATQPSQFNIRPIGEAEIQQLHSVYAEAKTLVEEQRGIEFKALRFQLASTEEIRAKLFSHYRLLHQNNTAEQQLSQTKAFQSSVQDSADWLHGLYLPLTKELLVNTASILEYASWMAYEHDIPEREFIMVLMIHELIHAADDIEFDIIGMHRRNIGDKLGVQMMIEGHAQLQTAEYCELAGCSNASKVELKDAQVPTKVEEDYWVESARRNNFYLLYGQSYEFLKSLQAKDAALVRQALVNPPGSVLEFFDADSYPNISRQRSREAIFNVLEALEIPDITLLQKPEPRFNDQTLSIDAQAREKQVRFMLTHEIVTGSMVYYDQKNFDQPALHIQITETKNQDYSRLLANHSLAKYRANPKSGDSNPTMAVNAANQGYAFENLWSGSRVEPDGNGGEITVVRHVFLHGRYVVYITNQDNTVLNRQAFIALRAILDSQGQEYLATNDL